MIRTFTKQLLSTTLSFLLVIGTTPLGAGAQEAATDGVFGTRCAADRG